MAIESDQSPAEQFKQEIDRMAVGTKEHQRQSMFNQLTPACRDDCTIVKLVIENVLKEQAKSLWLRERIGECVLGPKILGECGTEKVQCRHPEAGATDNFVAQVNILSDYFQS